MPEEKAAPWNSSFSQSIVEKSAAIVYTEG